ncbi:LacI family DNA-binding transcriptional regulator, partial [Nostocoides japonicum]
DVAVMAGVSDAVVSYTLNGRAPVAPATAERVREAIRTLGYRPNHTARALKSGSSGAIALIAPRGEDPAFTNPFFTEFAATAEDLARRRGFAFYMASYALDRETVVDRLQEFADRQVDGALIIPDDRRDRRSVAAIDAVGVPWVQVDTVDPIPGASTVGADLYRGGVDATTHLADHGHRRIGYVGHVGDEPRHRAWQDTCRRLGLDPGPALPARFTREGGYAAASRMVRAGDLPPALFAASDLVALGVLRAFHEAGVAVPDDVALVSFDGSWEAEYSWPALTSVRQPIEEMADAALTQLLAADSADSSEPTDPPDAADGLEASDGLAQRHRRERHSVFPGRLVLRASCGTH